MSNKNEVFEYLIDQLRQQVGSNLYKQQCEDLAHEVQSLKNQLRDMSELVDELMGTITLMNGDVEAYKVLRKCGYVPEQSGCRKDDTQECEHDWCFYDGGALMMCRICGLKSPNRQKEDTQECEHEWDVDGDYCMMCKKCGALA